MSKKQAGWVLSGLIGSVLCAIGIHQWGITSGVKYCTRCGRIKK